MTTPAKQAKDAKEDAPVPTLLSHLSLISRPGQSESITPTTMTSHAENLRPRMGLMLAAAVEAEQAAEKTLALAQDFRRRADDLNTALDELARLRLATKRKENTNGAPRELWRASGAN
jgi:hypothetical protein